MKNLISVLILALVVSCTSEQQVKDQLIKVLKEDPKVLTEAIEAHPAEIMMALQKAAKEAQGAMAKKREEEEKQKFEEAFTSPLNPEIRSDESFRGTKGGPITLVEYSDFQCPFCTRGFQTVQELMNKYPGKIQFVYKHLPLSFHQQAMLASQYYEAIRLQDEKKAFKFHDELFANQSKIKKGDAYLNKAAKQVGADMDKLKKDIESDKVKKRIEADMEEAAKFGMQGTPGFLLNGIPVRGAYPADYFVGIIEKLKAKGKLSL